MKSDIRKIFREGLVNETVEYLESVKFPTNTYIDLNYNFSGKLNVERNTVGGEYMGSMFGQDIEPKGYYCMQYDNTFNDDNPNFEIKTVQINKPIVIRTDDDTRIKWKSDLSKIFGDLTSKRLTNAIKKKGYDAIITADDKGYTWEIILF